MAMPMMMMMMMLMKMRFMAVMAKLGPIATMNEDDHTDDGEDDRPTDEGDNGGDDDDDDDDCAEDFSANMARLQTLDRSPYDGVPVLAPGHRASMDASNRRIQLLGLL